MPRYVFSYDSKRTLEERKAEVIKIQAKYPGRIPCLIETRFPEGIAQPLARCKFMIPEDVTAGAVVFYVRKEIGLHLRPEQGVFTFVDGLMVPMAITLGELYRTRKSDDGFLKFLMSAENTFG